jgi:uncharacterized protein YqeY
MIQAKIKTDLLEARKTKNADLMSWTQTLLGEFARIDKELSDDQAIAVLRKVAAGLAEMVKVKPETQAELLYVQSFQPQQMDEAQLREVVAAYKAENPTHTLKEFMPFLKQQYGNSIDMKMANQAFKQS